MLLFRWKTGVQWPWLPKAQAYSFLLADLSREDKQVDERVFKLLQGCLLRFGKRSLLHPDGLSTRFPSALCPGEYEEKQKTLNIKLFSSLIANHPNKCWNRIWHLFLWFFFRMVGWNRIHWWMPCCGTHSWAGSLVSGRIQSKLKLMPGAAQMQWPRHSCNASGLRIPEIPPTGVSVFYLRNFKTCFQLKISK